MRYIDFHWSVGPNFCKFWFAIHCRNRWMMTNLFTNNPCILSLKFKSFSKKGIERLVYSFIKTSKYSHEKWSNPCYSFIRVCKVWSFIYNIFTSTYLCYSLQNWNRLTKCTRNWYLPKLISINTSHNKFLHNLNVMLIIRFSSEWKLSSLLSCCSYFECIPKLMNST